jgi:hypothetical protein
MWVTGQASSRVNFYLQMLFKIPGPTLLSNDQDKTEDSLFTDLAGLPSADLPK